MQRMHKLLLTIFTRIFYHKLIEKVVIIRYFMISVITAFMVLLSNIVIYLNNPIIVIYILF